MSYWKKYAITEKNIFSTCCLTRTRCVFYLGSHGVQQIMWLLLDQLYSWKQYYTSLLERKAIQSQRFTSQIMIKPRDKGEVTGILNHKDYTEIKRQLSASNYSSVFSLKLKDTIKSALPAPRNLHKVIPHSPTPGTFDMLPRYTSMETLADPSFPKTSCALKLIFEEWHYLVKTFKPMTSQLKLKSD